MKHLHPDVQGAVLADLLSIWLAGHRPQYFGATAPGDGRIVRKFSSPPMV